MLSIIWRVLLCETTMLMAEVVCCGEDWGMGNYGGGGGLYRDRAK